MPFPFRNPIDESSTDEEEWKPPDYAVPSGSSNGGEEGWTPPDYAKPHKEQEKKSLFSKAVEPIKPPISRRPITFGETPKPEEPAKELTTDKELEEEAAHPHYDPATRADIKPETFGSAISSAVDKAKEFLARHPKIRSTAQFALTGSSPELETDIKARGLRPEIQGPGFQEIPGVKQATDYLAQKVTGEGGTGRLIAGAGVKALGDIIASGFDPRAVGIPETPLRPRAKIMEGPSLRQRPPIKPVEIAKTTPEPAKAVKEIEGEEPPAAAEWKPPAYAVASAAKEEETPKGRTFEEILKGFGGAGHPSEGPEYVKKVLDKAGKGEPGLSVEPVEGEKVTDLNAQHVVYRDKNGEPVAAAKIVQDQNGKNMVMDLATDKDKGLLSGRAIVAVGDKLDELKATEPAGTISKEGQNFLDRMRERQAQPRELAGILSETPATTQPPKLGRIQRMLGVENMKDAKLDDLKDVYDITKGSIDPAERKAATFLKLMIDQKEGKLRPTGRAEQIAELVRKPEERTGLPENIPSGIPKPPQAEDFHPQLSSFQNYGDGVLNMEFDKSAPMAAKDVQKLLSERGIDADITEMHTAADSPSRFRVDIKGDPSKTADIGNQLEQVIGGSFDSEVEMHGGLGFIGNIFKKLKTAWKGTGTKVDPVVDKLFSAIQTSKGQNVEQQAIYTAERARRFGASAGVKEKGMAGAAKSLAAMRGEYEKVIPQTNFKLSQEETDSLFNAVMDSKTITQAEKLRGYTALFKLLRGEKVPVRSELSVLDDVFGSGFADRVIQMHGGIGAVGVNISKLANTMKSLQNAMSLAAPLRHGIGLAYRKEFFPAFKDMFKFFADKDTYNAAMKAIAERPNYMLGRKSGLFLAKPGSLMNSEEEFLNSYIGDIPRGIKGLGIRNLVEASQRGYSGFLNKLRSDVFDSMVLQAKKLGHEPYTIVDGEVVPTKETEAIANFINNATGRGSLGPLNKITNEMNLLFWSPRMISSRINMLANPTIYTSLPKGMRLEGLKSLLGIAAFGVAVDTLAAMGGAKVTNNILSSDFAKARFGKKVIDPWGGFQQYIGAAARFLAAAGVNLNIGPIEARKTGTLPETMGSVAGKFLKNKESPAASFAHDILFAKKFTGGGGYISQYGQPQTIQGQASKQFVPIFIQDLYNIMEDDPEWADSIGLTAVMGGASLTGMAQEYPEPTTGRRMKFRKNLRP